MRHKALPKLERKLSGGEAVKRAINAGSRNASANAAVHKNHVGIV